MTLVLAVLVLSVCKKVLETKKKQKAAWLTTAPIGETSGMHARYSGGSRTIAQLVCVVNGEKINRNENKAGNKKIYAVNIKGLVMKGGCTNFR